jgi:hypothetical protein
MYRIGCFVLAAVLFVSLNISWTGSGFAKDQADPHQIVASHIQSIGSPAAVAQLKALGFVGTTNVEFLQGMTGNMNGNAMCVSQGNKQAIRLQYQDINYPGEYFAYDGKDVTVGHISPGQKSPLADFLFRHNEIMKEGLLGGVLSGGWPLLNLEAKQVDLKYRETSMDGQRLYEIEYHPKQWREVKIKLYFDPQTYQHVRTEYRVQVKDDMSAAPAGVGTRTGKFQTSDTDNSPGYETLRGGLPDSIYVLIEKFDDFKKVGAFTLPHTYTMTYSVEGQGHAFIGKWTVKAAQWIFNRSFENGLFVAQK